MERVLVLSSHTHPRLASPLNHRAYCERQGFDYIFDATRYHNRNAYDQKINCILAHLGSTDWLCWMDEDAFFMDHTKSLRDFIPAGNDIGVVLCKSPGNLDKWTVINSGVMLFRNCELVRELLKAVLKTDLRAVKKWWNPELHGYFSKGDQDLLVYQLMNRNFKKPDVTILPCEAFNARPFHYQKSYDEYFICHFAGVKHKDKNKAIGQFQKKFQLTEALMPLQRIAG